MAGTKTKAHAKAIGSALHNKFINGIDNRLLENLLICTIGYHRQLHARMKKHPYWTNFHD